MNPVFYFTIDCSPQGLTRVSGWFSKVHSYVISRGGPATAMASVIGHRKPRITGDDC